MKHLNTATQKLLRDEKGFITAEYIIMGALVVMVTVIIFTGMQTAVAENIDYLSGALGSIGS